MVRLADMTAKELRRLSRKDLLILLLDQEKQLEQLEQTLEETRAQHEREMSEKERSLTLVFAEREERYQVQIEYLRRRLVHERQKKADIPASEKASLAAVRKTFERIREPFHTMSKTVRSIKDAGRQERKRTNAKTD